MHRGQCKDNDPTKGQAGSDLRETEGTLPSPNEGSAGTAVAMMANGGTACTIICGRAMPFSPAMPAEHRSRGVDASRHGWHPCYSKRRAGSADGLRIPVDARDKSCAPTGTARADRPTERSSKPRHATARQVASSSSGLHCDAAHRVDCLPWQYRRRLAEKRLSVMCQRCQKSAILVAL